MLSLSTPTIVPASSFESKADAEALHGSLHLWGANTDSILAVLCKRSNGQRQEIVKKYSELFGKDLRKELSSDLWGNFKELVLALLDLPEDLDAKELHHALHHVSTNEAAVVEILATRCDDRLARLKSAYKRLYETDLVDDLRKHSEKNYHRFHVALVVGSQADVSSSKTESCAQQLSEQLPTSEDKPVLFSELLSSHSFAELKAVFRKYEELTGSPIENYVEKEFNAEDVDSWLLTAIKLMRNRAAYFAERLNHCLGGFEPSHRDVTRIIVSRSEEDLADIRESYRQMYGDALERVLCEFAGSYGKALYKLVAGNNDARTDTTSATTSV